MMKNFKDLVFQVQHHLPKWWLEKYGNFFHNNLYERFSDVMCSYFTDKQSLEIQPPYFDEEIITEKASIFKHFESIFQSLENENFNQNKTIEELSKIFVDIPFSEILLLSGQRITSASIRDERAIPPKKEDLIIQSFLPHNSQISIATRAWEKHVGRNKSDFWGEIDGNPTEKEMFVRALVDTFLDEHTWWNVFYHYKHELVYEIRIKSGQGMRWQLSNLNFIGFLEPFLQDETI